MKQDLNESDSLTAGAKRKKHKPYREQTPLGLESLLQEGIFELTDEDREWINAPAVGRERIE
ncbi:hypothetical protein [Marinobacterium sediminicola]|uniref:Uncharacterized protein n=1 Tax=Marinobacterium sediminicola TaxID=518898 RepID=A0ABY1S2R1_9GAMM|nr:hypothetical protein [Marinobacterium sediminicola]ULG68831.1 hypothetical protein LN244_14205 [Marinobacterium sediminicola]SMR77564.1 hypothetical protein SAMN04487964_11455 [Marinobacterium sediminicola]